MCSLLAVRTCVQSAGVTFELLSELLHAENLLLANKYIITLKHTLTIAII